MKKSKILNSFVAIIIFICLPVINFSIDAYAYEDKSTNSSIITPNMDLLKTYKSIPILSEETTDLTQVFDSPIGNVVGLSNNNKYLTITDSATQSGAIWGKYQINLKYDFSLYSFMYFGNKSHDAADGITFTMQTAGKNKKGEDGQYLGAYNGDLNGIAIEFDTYHNGDGLDNGINIRNDGYDHASFFDIKNMKHIGEKEIWSTAVDDQLSAGFWYKVKVNWSSKSKTLNYELSVLDEQVTTFTPLNETITLDTNSLFGEEYPSVYWGSTGSTGAKSKTLENKM